MLECDITLPAYELKEENDYIIITINAPLSKLKETVFTLEKNFLVFDSSPYLHKIKLPNLVYNKLLEESFNASTKTFRIKLKKIKELASANIEDTDKKATVLLHDNNSNSTIITPSVSSENEEKQHYGFANSYSNMFGKSCYEFSEVISLLDPDFTKVQDRRSLRIKEENEKWNDDHYLADTMETDHLETIFNYVPPWIEHPVSGDLSAYEVEKLELSKNTKNKLELIEDKKRMCKLQIVDILLCYAYNKRITEGDNTVESGWTINKLSSTLSWFDVFEDMKSVILSFYRRCLIFPLFRNWKLAEQVQKDVQNILEIGPKQVTHCLLEVKEIFQESENRFILNTLYINDLCQYSYFMTMEESLELSKEVEKVVITKYEVNNDLPYLEIAAHLTLEEELNGIEGKKDINDVVDKISKLNLKEGSSSSSESSDSSESDSDESSSIKAADERY